MTQRPRINRSASIDIARAVLDGDLLDRAMVAARRRVILQHRLLGVPLAIWRDGKVVEVAPESVELPGEDLDPKSPERER